MHTMKTALKTAFHSFRKIAYLLFLATALATVALATPAWAEKKPIYTSFFSKAGAGGYDVTAYFSEGKPVKGKEKFKTRYMGADWLFANEENLAAFIAAPEKYAPQYGGYCAWAVAQGGTASGDPLLWTVHNDKLYLNYNESINERWSADMPTGTTSLPSAMKIGRRCSSNLNNWGCFDKAAKSAIRLRLPLSRIFLRAWACGMRHVAREGDDIATFRAFALQSRDCLIRPDSI